MSERNSPVPEKGINQKIVVAVDTVAFTVKDGKLLTLLVKRRALKAGETEQNYPFPECWGLPGGLVDKDVDKTAEMTAKKKLEAKTGINVRFLEQLGAYADDERDPRGWSISIVYFILMRFVEELLDTDEVIDAQWVDVLMLADHDPLAFDHQRIICDAVKRLQEKTRYSLLPAYCLNEKFTFSEFHDAVETILGHPVQKKSLYRRIEESEVLEGTGEMRKTGAREAELFRATDRARDYFFERNLVRSKQSKNSTRSLK